MEKQFKELAYKCFMHDLRFEYIPASNGIVIMDGEYQKVISSGWIDVHYHTAEKVLKMMNKEVDAHIEEAKNGSERKLAKVSGQ